MLVGTMALMPDTGQAQRRPSGSGIATSAPGMKRQRSPDAARQAAAVRKRERKNFRRLRTWTGARDGF
jgi:hypothetical protein